MHKSINCNIKDCKESATRWFSTYDTFYLCENHAGELSPDDEQIQLLNLTDGTINYTELAVYSCSPKCKECNS